MKKSEKLSNLKNSLDTIKKEIENLSKNENQKDIPANVIKDLKKDLKDLDKAKSVVITLPVTITVDINVDVYDEDLNIYDDVEDAIYGGDGLSLTENMIRKTSLFKSELAKCKADAKTFQTKFSRVAKEYGWTKEDLWEKIS